VPVILVRFTDQPLVYSEPQPWATALFDTTGSTPTGSVYDYYLWVSGGRLRVLGQVVAVVSLPQAKAYYGNDSWGLSRSATPENAAGVVRDALRACDAAVDWRQFPLDPDGNVEVVWVVHSGLGGETTLNRADLWSQTSQLHNWSGTDATGGIETNDLVPGSTTKKIRLDEFSILPELSSFHPGARSEIGVYCHEFGHTLGLPDLYDTEHEPGTLFNVGPGNWSLMSTGLYGTDGHSPEFPSHIGAWPALFLGWGRKLTPTQDTLLVVEPVERGGSILDFWFQGEPSSERFLIEHRRREGFDRNLPADGLIVYHVDESSIGARLEGNVVNAGPNPALTIVEADGARDLILGRSRGDSLDPFPGALGVTNWTEDGHPDTRSFSGATTNLALRGIERVDEGVRCFAQVRARGWLPARTVSDPSSTPSVAGGPATHAVLLGDGSIAAVASELVAGRRQVVLRTGHDGLWDPPFTVSASPASANEPTLAALPGGDLAVVWSDLRHRASQLYYRSRIRGVWTAEQRLAELTGSSQQPSVSADARGGVHVAWLQTASGTPQLMFLYFPYTSPFGDPRSLTSSAQIPGAPTVAASPDGSSYVVWPERSISPTTLWFARFDPVSRIGARQRLTLSGGDAQVSAHAVVDAAGTLHVAWQVSGSGVNEIHYQRRPAGLSPDPADTTLERRVEPVQAPVLSVDRLGGVHLAIEALASGVSQVRYKEWEPGHGWQVSSTEVTQPAEGSAARPTALATQPGVVTVLYVGYVANQPVLMERKRDAWSAPVTTIADRVPPPPPTLVVGPNPLRSGDALQIWLSAGAAGLAPGVDLFDLSGREVASARLENRGNEWHGVLTGSRTATLSSGIYFVRARGTTSMARVVVLR
jgi:immune inhibitor A